MRRVVWVYLPISSKTPVQLLAIRETYHGWAVLVNTLALLAHEISNAV